MFAEAGADVLVERDAETAAVAAAIDRACGSAGGVVVVDGPPGIGKTRLSMEAAALAAQRGMSVLRARGGELECDLTYGVARQLLERTLHDAVGDERTRLLAGQARLAIAALSPGAEGGPIATETGIDHGLFWLVCNIAERQPVALFIDDAHWADVASLRFLVYLARRIDGLPVLVVLTARPVERDGARKLLDLIAAEPLAEQISLEPLSTAGAAVLLAARLDRSVPGRLAQVCHDVCAGNPFFLLEIARSLGEAGGDEDDLIAQASALPPRTVTRSILVRLGLGGEDARVVAQVLAVAGDGAPADVLGELAGLDTAAVTAALERLSLGGITTRSGELGFEHPIVRGAIYHDLPLSRRRALHAAAARALISRGSEPLQIAHHLLLGEPGNDPDVARMLMALGRRAIAHGEAEVATQMFSRALSEPPAQEDRGDLLTALGEAEIAAGRAADAVAHLRAAIDLASSPRLRSRPVIALASALLATAGPNESLTFLATEAQRVEGDDALRLEVERATIAMWVRGAVDLPWLDGLLAEFGDLPGTTLAQRLGLTQAALAVAYDPGASATRASILARRALGDGRLLAELGVDGVAVGMAAYVLVMAADFEAAEPELGRMLNDARERGSAFGYAGVGLLSGQLALQRGALGAATAHFESALTGARSMEESPVTMRCIGFAESWLIEALLHRGDAAGARAVVDDAAAAGDFDRAELVWSRYGRGLFRLLAEADPAGAAEELLAFGAAARAGAYEDREAPWRAWAALALSAVGAGTDAIALAEEQLRIASAWAPAARGAALRVRAVVGAPADAETLLGESVGLLAESGRRLEHARALVDHGVALRRAGRRRDARARLESGLDLAARCEAAPLVQRAREELLILGSRPRRMMFSGVESLTATERRVADMAAGGMTNREIAQASFVTLKTVEVHLSQCYRKLGIGSRRQLAGALDAGEPLAAAGRSGAT